jgi:hypothetical protein
VIDTGLDKMVLSWKAGPVLAAAVSGAVVIR